MEGVKRRRGRPRVHVSNAERQRAYRKRQKTTRPPKSCDLLAWNKYLAKINLSVDAGRYLEDAPAGRGLLHSGGNNIENLDYLDARESLSPGSRRVRPKGHGPSVEEKAQPERDTEEILQREIEAMDREEALRKSTLNP